MTLKDLLHKYHCRLFGDDGKDIKGITYDSRAVGEGFIFAAVRGGTADGHNFIEQAISGGASAVVCEEGHPLLPALIKKYPSVSWVHVSDVRDALAALSSSFYQKPSENVAVVGITGTNGKTTTSYLIKSILEKWSKGVGLIGTINYMIKDEYFAAPHTTPEASDFQGMLREMARRGCDYAVAEVSSHALVQKRVDHTQFKVAIFTNLTGDHLDFHGTMEEYFNAKVRLFTELLADGGTAVINVDDQYGKRLCDILREQRSSLRIITFGLTDREADVVVEDVRPTFRGTLFTLRISGMTEVEFFSPLVGQTSLYNIMSAVSAVLPLNVPMDAIKEGVATLDLVKGRFERVDLGQPFLAVVDYAHTHDAIERLLITARQLLKACPAGQKISGRNCGKIITVFGCGGNRDKGKRPKMGRIASDLSDFVIVTSDNPRYEDPAAIIRDIESGISKDNYIVIPDRRTAVRMSVMLASPGDIIMVAGKGHEDYQEINGIRHPFSDRSVLEDAIRESAAVTARVRAKKRYLGAAICLS